MLTVLPSPLLHGATAYPLARAHGGWLVRVGEPEAEHAPAREMPVRVRHAGA